MTALVLTALVFSLAVAYMEVQKEKRNNTPSASGLVVSDAIGGPFNLVNQDNEPVSHETYADRYKLIYFGFTYCPAICPTELQKMMLAYDRLGALSEDVYPIFISVDPERDTPEVVKDYTGLFGDGLIGLTGSKDQVQDVIDVYKVYASKVREETMSDYTMDHSSFTYLMSPDNKLIGLFKIEDTANEMAGEIRRIITIHKSTGRNT